jgi:hypothetical protein
MLIVGDHAAAVHFVEDQLLFFLRYFALDLKVVFKVLLAGGEEQYLDVDKPFECLELEVAGRLFGKEFRRRSFDALAGYVDIADAGEDVGACRWFGGVSAGGDEGDKAESEETRQGGLLGSVYLAS